MVLGGKNRSQVAVPNNLFESHGQALIERGCSADKVKLLHNQHQVTKERMELIAEWFDWELDRKPVSQMQVGGVTLRAKTIATTEGVNGHRPCTPPKRRGHVRRKSHFI